MISDSEKQTRLIAAGLVKKYRRELKAKCLIFTLRGDLGSGKTVFAKGVAEALGIKKIIRSPSFIIKREFSFGIDKVKGNFVHFDLWRMESEEEVRKLKIEDSIKPGNVILIEWAEKTSRLLKKILSDKETVVFTIKISETKENFRKIRILVKE
ncbi:MAG TPA: tRNA (adenosine(37)-N6)-threonylcarbamoyltransferase complex ATPase subunit type 1 TsaE [Candidatus Woesebacteria bacterium]|nr:tRNA (adenosine(37)-N6)-threonylcarbamoyltransferase complex ATPase subunit type 1 TsaE [Candidatus Woesebacteria bacterium]